MSKQKMAFDDWAASKKLNQVQAANILFVSRSALKNALARESRGYTMLKRLYLLTGLEIFEPKPDEEAVFQQKKWSNEKAESLMDLVIGELFIQRYLTTGRLPDDDELLQYRGDATRNRAELVQLIAKRYQILKVSNGYRVKNPEGKGAAQTQAAKLCAELEHVAQLPEADQREWIRTNLPSLKKLQGYMTMLQQQPGNWAKGFEAIHQAYTVAGVIA